MTSDCCGSEVVMDICRRCGEHCCEVQETPGAFTDQFESLFREKWTRHHSKKGNSLDKAHEWRLYLERNGICSFRPRLAHSQVHKGETVFSWGGKEYYYLKGHYVPVEFAWRAVVLGSLP